MNAKMEMKQENCWITVCSLDDLVLNSGICVLHEGKQVAIFQLENCANLFAIDNFDPFSQANVLSRGIVGSVHDTKVVASPIYKQHFCLESGQCMEDAEVSIDVYRVRIFEDKVQLASSTANP